MAGPFPGMDPYLELQAAWPDFHNGLIAEIRNELGARLPDSYVARVDERIEVATWALEPPRSFRPDVLVGRFEKGAVSPGVTLATAPAATLEPKLGGDSRPRPRGASHHVGRDPRIARAGVGDGRRGPFPDQQVGARAPGRIWTSATSFMRRV